VLIARLRRRHPMADKYVQLIPKTCHSLLAEDVPAPGARLKVVHVTVDPSIRTGACFRRSSGTRSVSSSFALTTWIWKVGCTPAQAEHAAMLALLNQPGWDGSSRGHS
jgi:hypothetical protein